MKRYLVVFVIALIGLNNDASALALLDNTCKKMGYTPGDTCPSGDTSAALLLSKCDADRPNKPCIIVSCNGQCYCAQTTDCDSGEIRPTLDTCSDKPTWNGASTTNPGTLLGTCHKFGGSIMTVYGCADGYYSGTLQAAGTNEEYSTTELTCTKCPKHPDDIKTYKNLQNIEIAAPYVSTGGDGNHVISSCKIIANSEITDSTGTFAYEQDCKYDFSFIIQ